MRRWFKTLIVLLILVALVFGGGYLNGLYRIYVLHVIGVQQQQHLSVWQTILIGLLK